MREILSASLPELLGSLGAGLVLSVGTWAAARFRSRRINLRDDEDADRAVDFR